MLCVLLFCFVQKDQKQTKKYTRMKKFFTIFALGLMMMSLGAQPAQAATKDDVSDAKEQLKDYYLDVMPLLQMVPMEASELSTLKNALKAATDVYNNPNATLQEVNAQIAILDAIGGSHGQGFFDFYRTMLIPEITALAEEDDNEECQKIIADAIALVNEQLGTYDPEKTFKENAQKIEPISHLLTDVKDALEKARPKVYTEFDIYTQTLTYFYNNKYDKDNPNHRLYDLDDYYRFKTINEEIQTAIIDASMKDAKLTSMAKMFYCGDVYEATITLPNLTTIIGLENLNTENVTNMYCMFRGCKSLQGKLDLSHFSTEKVEYMIGMFDGCEALTEIDLRGFNVKNVQSTERMFSGCKELTTIYCDNDWSIEATSLSASSNMFSACSKLVGGNGTKYDSNFTGVSYACPDGLNDKQGYFTTNLPKIYTVYDGDVTLTYYYDRNYNERKSVGTVEFYDPDNVLKQARWKEYSDDVETVIIDPSMKNAPLTSLKGMFYPGYDYEEGDDYHLSYAGTITGLNYLNTENVTDMSYMFYECAELTVLDLTSFSIENLENTTKMFYDCEYLTTIYCNANMSASSKLTSASNMFYNCEELKGGKDTEFDSGKIGKDYARPDGGSATPGYFTTLDMNDKAKLYAYIRDMKMLYNFAAQYVDKSEDDMSDFKHFIETFEDTYENGTDAAISGAIALASTQKDNYIGILIEEGKTALKDILQSKLMPGDNAECQQIIADAQDAVDALEWDDSKSVEENIAILDPAIQKILADADAALAAARLAAGIEQANSQEPIANSQKFLRNGQLLILRDGKMYNVMGVEVR